MKISTSSLVGVGCLALATCLCVQADRDYFKTHTNVTVKDQYIYDKDIALDAIHCAAHCVANGSCLSSSYNDVNQSCHLSLYRTNGSDDKVISRSSWMTLSRNGCSDDWIKIGEKCYLFRDKLSKQNEAQEFCGQFGAKLAEPQTNSSYQLLRNYMIDEIGDESYWLGLIMMGYANNITYVWSSNGAATTYTDWSAGVPIFLYTIDRCVTLNGGYRWQAENCNVHRKAICEN